MSKSVSESYVHITWATNHRFPFLVNLELRSKVFGHIMKNAISRGIQILAIGGFEDHVHCLLRLPRNASLGEIVQKIKGESSYWINRNLLFPEHFSWGQGYHVESVNPDHLDKVRNYIFNQAERHKQINH